MEFVQDLNYDIDTENYIKDLQELLNELNGGTLTLRSNPDELSSLACVLLKEFNENSVKIMVTVEFDKKMLYKIKINWEPLHEDDKNDYEMEIKRFYFEEIKSRLFDAVNKRKSKFTLRIYKIIYNSTSINGRYDIHWENKISFHTLYILPKDEPLTEHIICFDIELEERNFERARSSANNIISDFCAFLSVLLDIGFYEPTSKFMNFIKTKYNGANKCFVCERFRTAFYDPELKLFVKDNMNGLCPEKNVEKGNFMNGYFSFSWNTSNEMVQMKIGDAFSIEEVFSKHRIYKVNPNKDFVSEYQEMIDDQIHFLNQPIKVPKQIRSYFRGINKYKKKNYRNYIFFRNACRLYNKSKTLGLNDASIEISFLVASLETLSKTEGKTNFSDFVVKYNANAKRKDLDDLYSIRSKLFHAGEFSFFEFEFDVNPYSDPLYFEFENKYVLFKSVLRKTYINWISLNIIELDTE